VYSSPPNIGNPNPELMSIPDILFITAYGYGSPRVKPLDMAAANASDPVTVDSWYEAELYGTVVISDVCT
jgi:hypothetical protein